MDALIKVEVNTDGLAKLAETFGNWTGLNARGKERMADAEAYAEVRKVDAQNAAALARLEGEERIAQYIYTRESRKMNNVQQIVNKAEEQFAEGEQVSSEPVNQDWQNRFFSIAEDISDEEMQKLWAQILAGEVKHPKSFSLRTLEALRNISKEEAESIQKVAKFIIDTNSLCSEKFALQLTDQLLMDELGIVKGETLTRTYHIKPDSPYNLILGKQVFLTLYSSKNIKVKLSHYAISKIGLEIFKLVTEDIDDQYILNLSNHLKTLGVERITKNKIIKWNESQYTYNCNLECEI